MPSYVEYCIEQPGGATFKVLPASKAPKTTKVTAMAVRSPSPYPSDTHPMSRASSLTVTGDTELRSRGKSRYWLGIVDLKHADLLLFPCCFVQGLLDASAL